MGGRREIGLVLSCEVSTGLLKVRFGEFRGEGGGQLQFFRISLDQIGLWAADR